MNKKEHRDILMLSATLFSMFFGAGNLIFPPYVGFFSGTKWGLALLGFFLTGTGLPLLGIAASAKSEGDINKLGEKVSVPFSKALGLIIVLSIGPLMAIPRTGATTFEMSILPLFPNFSPIVFAIIYFTISFILVINPTEIVNRVGKILTPSLIFILILIIITGIINPIGEIIDTNATNAFTDGFEIGYQTMDAFAALLFGGVIIFAIQGMGYDSLEKQISMTLKSGIIAAIGLTVIYGGLGYLGATATSSVGVEVSRPELILLLAENGLKSFGKIGLAIVVALACLTTTIGLITTVGQYFHNNTNGKLSYRLVVILTTIVSAILSVVGVDGIVRFSGPILSLMYPIVIVLIFLTILLKSDTSQRVFQVPILLTSIISLAQLLIDYDMLSGNVLNWLPLSSLKLAWIGPAILGVIIGFMISNKEQTE